jgi:recombination associated protein RdgC
MRFQSESKILPAAVLRKHAQERAVHIESQTGRRPGKKEMRDLRDEARLDLLPQAFTRQSGVDVWLDKKAGLLMVGTGTQARADELTSALVDACTGLSLNLLQTKTSARTAMAHWLTQQAPQGFALGDECELRAIDESRAIVRYARHSLEIDEIRQHIAQGKLPVKMALHWQDRVHFVLTEDLQLKKIVFEDGVFEHLLKDDRGFDADALIATRELAQLMDDLATALDGWVS